MSQSSKPAKSTTQGTTSEKEPRRSFRIRTGLRAGDASVPKLDGSSKDGAY